MPDILPRRSILYVPVDRPRAVAKARSLPVDAIILDLEDAVAPEAKAAARESLREATADPLPGELAVRVNATDTSWFAADVRAAAACGADAILLPKVEGPEPIRRAAELLAGSGAPDIEIWAMIETPTALLHLPAIAALADLPDVPLSCFVIGCNDLSLTTRVPLAEGRAAFVPWFMQIVAAARAHDIDVIDGVCNDFRDAGRLEEECRQARMLGMDGKSLIHPSQVACANRIFSPDTGEIRHAEEVAALFAAPGNAGRAVLSHDGRMVERLHLEAAERVLVVAAAIREREAH